MGPEDWRRRAERQRRGVLVGAQAEIKPLYFLLEPLDTPYIPPPFLPFFPLLLYSPFPFMLTWPHPQKQTPFP